MKKGFTLAEVLITLTVIGVVAALAAPALSNSTQKAKVGPALSKFINTMETANEHIIADNQADSISSVTDSKADNYLTELSKYVKGLKEDKTLKDITLTPANYNGDSDKDGSPMKEEEVENFAIYTFSDGSAMALKHYDRDTTHSAGTFKGNVASVWFDINGFDKKPNRAGRDEFRFYIDDSGSVYPDGGNIKKNIYEKNNIKITGNHWNEENGACNETDVKRGGV